MELLAKFRLINPSSTLKKQLMLNLARLSREIIHYSNYSIDNLEKSQKFH